MKIRLVVSLLVTVLIYGCAAQEPVKKGNDNTLAMAELRSAIDSLSGENWRKSLK